MSDKVEKLRVATEGSKERMDRAKAAFDDSLRRLNAAKEALREMDQEDQNKIMINDTQLPELIDLHSISTEEYNEAKSRHETNLRYLELFKAKGQN
mmetsp:Transcript_8643/g.13034  ORF Transcript_8643/g.13034 Transcript_8643/m.13034 type:complete len:96 (-) Transcript_8643:209-496(-)